MKTFEGRLNIELYPNAKSFGKVILPLTIDTNKTLEEEANIIIQDFMLKGYKNITPYRVYLTDFTERK